ncbi:hypothetical protein [Aliidiomarina soli]|uniref:Uncharacterized protein n=1 Tax=Aliidiomarina soli TaxID=1928574 RepID=A0A432WE76_9GAMM|nr:hypothetical protein [Aliidiomarina soli]RUO31130.1 hypothetical protein CWE14_11585 [Aliidiomarina soli]
MTDYTYPSWKVFLIIMSSPAMGGAGIIVVSTAWDFIKKGEPVDGGVFFALLFMFSVVGFLIYCIPMLAISLLCVSLKMKGRLVNYLFTALLGGVTALFWVGVIFSGGKQIVDTDKPLFIQYYFFLAGFLSCLLTSWLAFPKVTKQSPKDGKSS